MAALPRVQVDQATPQRRTVLVAEDEGLVRALLCETLRDAGYAVLEAASADEALLLMQGPAWPGVLITDVAMPGSMDGLTLSARTRALKPDLKVIVTSGSASAHAAQNVADDFLAKPYGLDELLRRVRSVFGES